jgi:hypothetical protein
MSTEIPRNPMQPLVMTGDVIRFKENAIQECRRYWGEYSEGPCAASVTLVCVPDDGYMELLPVKQWQRESEIATGNAARLKHITEWVAVRDLCGLGKSSAIELCVEYGFDPDKPIAILDDE